MSYYVQFISMFIKCPTFPIIILQCSPYVFWDVFFTNLVTYRLSMTVPSISTNALSYGAFYGLYANLRYQMLCGLDRSMVNHFDVLGVAIFFSTAIR